LQGKETDPAATESIRSALHEVRPITIELMNYRKDGTPFWNKVSITPVRDESGRLTHFVGIQVDVTETRNTREQLRQSQKMDAIGRLAGGLAHDFNNLLAVIDSFAEMLLENHVDSEPARSFVQQIQSTSVLGANLTQQLLAFGRRQTRSPEALDFNVVVRETIQMLRRLLGNEIDLELSLAPDLKWVFADRSQMTQLLINLTINARDAMSGRGQLSVRTESVIITTPHLVYGYRLEPGEYAYLEVTDTGCGMTADILDQIFEPLFTTKPIGQGTGLGLSTVYGIITQSGGGIEVDSSVGTGTTFGIYLPIA
jgi:signal transduction histidine kinase